MTSPRLPLVRGLGWIAVGGFVLVAVGAVMPWQTMRYPAEPPVVTRGIDGWSAPGVQAILFAAIAAWLTTRRWVAASRVRIIQLLPALAGLAVLVVAVQFYRDVAPRGLWDPLQSGDVVVEGGMWAVLLGSFLIALSGLATTAVAIATTPRRAVKRPADPAPRLPANVAMPDGDVRRERVHRH